MSQNSKAQSFLNKMKNAKTGNNRPQYKRMYIQGGGKEYKLHLLSTELIDATEIPFETVWLHGQYKHPNFPEQQYGSNFRCLGGMKNGCPMCLDVKDIRDFEKAQNIPPKEKTAFKKQAKPYALYWAINLVNNELTLVHVPKRGMYDDDIPAQEVLFNKIENFVKETGRIPFDYENGAIVTITSKTINKKDKYSVEIDMTPHDVSPKLLKLYETMPTLKSIYKPYTKEDLDNVVKGIRIERSSTAQKQEKSKREDLHNEITNLSEESFNMDELDNEFAASETSPIDDGLTEDERKLLGDSEADTAFLEDGEFNLDPNDDSNELSKKLSKLDIK
jgi:hypothetical protein